MTLSPVQRNCLALVGLVAAFLAIRWYGDANASTRAPWNLPLSKQVFVPLLFGAAGFFAYAGTLWTRTLLAALVPVLAQVLWEAWWHAEVVYPYLLLILAVPYALLAFIGAVVAGVPYLAWRGSTERAPFVGPMRTAAVACAVLGNFVHFALVAMSVGGWPTFIDQAIRSHTLSKCLECSIEFALFQHVIWIGWPFYMLCIVALANRSITMLGLTLGAIAALIALDVAWFNATNSKDGYALFAPLLLLGPVAIAGLVFLAWLGNRLAGREERVPPAGDLSPTKE